MNQDFTVQKRQYLSEKKNSCRGVHLKKNSCKSSERQKKIRASWKFPTAPPPPNHFSNGPSLTLSHYYYATLKISRREHPHRRDGDTRRLALGVWDGKSLYLLTQVSFSTLHKKIYKKGPDADQTEISLRGQFKLEPHPHWSPFGI